MARNVCLDCGYFLNCKLASEHITYCEKFVKAHRTITKIDDIRNMFSDVYDFIETNCKQSRETSLAITKLEEAQFWAIKGITREEN